MTSSPARVATQDPPRPSRRGRATRLRLALLGPGLMVMLADTDAGSVLTAAQSGAQWGYRLVLSQLLLVPVLYVVQEVTVRLGIVTGEGHGALIAREFGRGWALLSASTLFLACLGALTSEFVGIAGVGALAGIPDWVSVGVTVAGLLTLLVTARYPRIERVGLAVGVLELLAVPAALLVHPHAGAVAHGLAHPFVAQRDFVVLLAANVGAVIMPWMVFYQQEAVIEKGLRRRPRDEALRAARADTFVGSLVTQLVMAAVVVLLAATLGRTHPGAAISTVRDVVDGLAPALGRTSAELLFGAALAGAAVVSAIVVTLAGAWGVSEVLGWRHSVSEPVRLAPRFYLVAAAGLIGGAAVVVATPDPVGLAVDVQVLNAALLPVVLGFLLALERRALPPGLRMSGLRRAATYAMSGAVSALGAVVAVTVLT